MTKRELLDLLKADVIGQDHVLEAIVPHVVMHMAGLSPEGRPLGVFLLLGPTGTGKTHTVASVAKALHGSPKNLIRIDCGEFSLEHEVAKLLGAPPGYLGHRETQALITPAKLNNITSNRHSASIVLFDEIEKAAPSLYRVILGVLDHGTMTLGDNTQVSFESSLIFLTSNLGASGIRRLMKPYGLPAFLSAGEVERSIEDVAVSSAKRHFSPEFFNRLDCVTTYHPLSDQCIGKILDIKLGGAEKLVQRRLNDEFRLTVRPAARARLAAEGFSQEYGGREINRVISRRIMQPLSELSLEEGPGVLDEAFFDAVNGEVALLRSARAGCR